VHSVEQLGGGNDGMSLAEFREHVRSLSDPTVRLAAVFQTSVLFAKTRPGLVDRVFRLAGAHWVTLVAYLPQEDLVLVADPSKLRQRGWLVSPQDLLRQVNIRCCITARCRGLVRLRLQGAGNNEATTSER
jgi:hypothetical protein